MRQQQPRARWLAGRCGQPDSYHQQHRLANGRQHLCRVRLGTGSCRFFPSWYTVWALLEIDSPEAIEELRYTTPVLERRVKRSVAEADRYGLRRQEIVRRALAVI